jgi:hypothetical protein
LLEESLIATAKYLGQKIKCHASGTYAYIPYE